MDGLTALANGAIAASTAPGAWRWWRATHDVHAAQERLWARIRDRNATSAYGRAHGFGRRPALTAIASLPTMCGDDLATLRARWDADHADGPTSEPIVRWLPTGGSGGGRKEVPYTRELLAQFQAGLDPWLWSLYRRHPRLLGGCAYWQITPALRVAGEAADTGDDTEYLGAFRAALTRRVVAVPAGVGAARDLDAFHHATLLHLVRRRDLAFVSVWNPSFLALLLDALPPRAEAIAVALRRAGDARRADALARALAPGAGDPHARDREGRTWPERLWPALAVVSCWADGHAAAPARALAERLPHVAIEPKGLVATEGIVSFPWTAEAHALAITSHVFEFLPDAAPHERRLAHELVRGRDYRVLVTTGGGLYRYVLGDVVRVTGHVNGCPLVRFLGRHDGVVDRAGEKLAPLQVQRAIASALTATGTEARFAMLAPDPRADGTPGYTLFASLDDRGCASASALAAALDEALGANPQYAYARALGQLAPVRVFAIDLAADADALALAHASRTQRLGAIKPPVLDRRDDWAGVLPGGYAD